MIYIYVCLWYFVHCICLIMDHLGEYVQVINLKIILSWTEDSFQGIIYHTSVINVWIQHKTGMDDLFR